MVLLLVNNLFKLAKNLGLKQEILVHKNSFNVKWRPSDSLCCKQKSMNLFWFYYNHDCSILILLLPIKNAFSKKKYYLRWVCEYSCSGDYNNHQEQYCLQGLRVRCARNKILPEKNRNKTFKCRITFFLRRKLILTNINNLNKCFGDGIFIQFFIITVSQCFKQFVDFYLFHWKMGLFP